MSILNGTEESEKISLLTGNPIRQARAYESVTEIKDPESGARVKIWRSEKEFPEYADEEILRLFHKIPGGASMPQMADAISSLPGVTKIEMTDKNGLGAMIFLES